MAASLSAWALPRLQQLLPLDNDSLEQIITYAQSLPKEESAEHLKNLLGDDAKSLEFISSFNLRRSSPPVAPAATSAAASQEPAGVPRRPRPQQKKKANIHALPPREVAGQGNVSGGYQKSGIEDDYVAGASRERLKHKDNVAESLALRPVQSSATPPLITDDVQQGQQASSGHSSSSTRELPGLDSFKSKQDSATRKSNASSRNSSPMPRTKVNITGGTAMHGASTALSDLDSAIRSLEMQTNPVLTSGSGNEERRTCDCMATRHPLLDMAPNCLNCGKVICVKQGIGPCTFCGSQLMSADEIQKILRVLKDERGEERMRVNNVSHKKAEVASGKAKAYTGREFLAQASSARSSPLSSQVQTPSASDNEANDKARAHRDKLLNFQANNARRTQIHDEAADWDVPAAGTNMWASPQERAHQLKKQQRVLREMEWNARPEYEKRQVVASIDLKGGKVVRRMAEVERPSFDADVDEEPNQGRQAPLAGSTTNAFGANPLAASLIRPLAREGEREQTARVNKTTWQRVQMDADQMGD